MYLSSFWAIRPRALRSLRLRWMIYALAYAGTFNPRFWSESRSIDRR